MIVGSGDGIYFGDGSMVGTNFAVAVDSCSLFPPVHAVKRTETPETINVNVKAIPI